MCQDLDVIIRLKVAKCQTFLLWHLTFCKMVFILVLPVVTIGCYWDILI